MVLFQINTRSHKTAPKVARYFKMDEYNVVIQKFQEMLRNGEIFDFEVIK